MLQMDYKLTRCPICGSTSLTPAYEDESQKGGDFWMFLFGFFGLAFAALKSKFKRNQVYWICNNCGNHFTDMD